jgi:26S proteasome regulatory subunit N12
LRNARRLSTTIQADNEQPLSGTILTHFNPAIIFRLLPRKQDTLSPPASNRSFLILSHLHHTILAAMPSATITQVSSLEHVLHSLQQSLRHNEDPSHTQPQLQQAKLALLHHGALIPTPHKSTQTLTTARSILETGALLSIRARNPQSFIRYYSQLQPFYDTETLHASRDRSKITGLYLLLLLSQGDYAGFHTLLETLIVAEGPNAEKGKTVEDDPYIKYPIELERSLMEGSYDQVWRKTRGGDVPGEEYALFSEVSLCSSRTKMIH